MFGHGAPISDNHTYQSLYNLVRYAGNGSNRAAAAPRVVSRTPMTAGGAHYDALIERLEAIAEDLGDLAYERLRELASDPDGDGAARAKAEERTLLSARRAIAKSIESLRSLTARAD